MNASTLSSTMTHLLKMRRLMRAEASALAKELERQQKTLRKRLQQLQKSLQKESDAVLLSELGSMRDELASVRHGLARLSIAEQSTAKLKNEWHDWMRHIELSDTAVHSLRDERLEMIASELRLRGIEIRPHHITESCVKECEHVEEVPTIETELLQIDENERETAEMTQQETETIDWVRVSDYWERLIAGCDPEHTDEAQLMRLLRAFRDVQGERKIYDRQNGLRRERLGAFEGWIA